MAAIKSPVEPSTEKISGTLTQAATEIPTGTPTLLLSNDIRVPQEVRRHIRTLPEGWKASPEKIASALEYNIILTERQTWVDSYIKGSDIA